MHAEYTITLVKMEGKESSCHFARLRVGKECKKLPWEGKQERGL